jgi:hypothetical protein
MWCGFSGHALLGGIGPMDEEMVRAIGLPSDRARRRTSRSGTGESQGRPIPLSVRPPNWLLKAAPLRVRGPRTKGPTPGWWE